jgi:hypothetical protein
MKRIVCNVVWIYVLLVSYNNVQIPGVTAHTNKCSRSRCPLYVETLLQTSLYQGLQILNCTDRNSDILKIVYKLNLFETSYVT